MEPLTHHQRRKRNSPKVNLVFSLVFHGLIVAAVVLFAAHKGYLGKKLETITAVLVPKEKPKPEPEKPPEPKVQTPTPEAPKVAEQPKIVEAAPVQTAAPPSASAGTVAAPAAIVPADFTFGDGAKAVNTSGDPLVLYKNTVEFALRSNWDRPADLDDFGFVAEVEILVDSQGRITGSIWKKGSGNERWDESVKKAIASTPSAVRPPPKGFPSRFLVRFDVVQTTSDLLEQ